jgi:Protein of unknown function (DUF4013)
MTEANDTIKSNLLDSFKYPFSDSRWFQKILVAVLLVLASVIIPVVPSIFLIGYYYQISHRIIKGDGVAALPEWDDWSKLFVNGFKYWAASFIYYLPMTLCFLTAYALMIVPAFVLGFSTQSHEVDQFFPFMMKSILPVLLSYPLMSVGMLLSVITGIVSPPALMHLVEKGSFGAAFEFSHWWKVFRSNFGGFALSYLLLFASLMVLSLTSSILMMTVILICLYPVLVFFVSVYIGVVSAALFGQAYRTGMEKLGGTGTVLTQAVKTPSPRMPSDIVTKPKRKPRAAVVKKSG